MKRNRPHFKASDRSGTGYSNVTQTRTGGFTARVSIDGKPLHLGIFETSEMAYGARLGALKIGGKRIV